MSLRVLACLLFVLGFSIYAWRNWFVSLCAALVMMAVLEHPDMPQNVGGIQGLNPWNVLMLNVLRGWASQRRPEGLVWDMPGLMQTALLLYCGLLLLSGLWLLMNPAGWDSRGVGVTLGENIINTFKWMIPGMLLYDGCRTRGRAKLALACYLLIYVLLAIQVIRWMPLSYAASGPEMAQRASKIIQNEIGYNRVTLSMMLGGASWALLACLVLCRTHLQRAAVLGAAGAVTLGQALTGGRTGYVAWALVGITMCTLRWRRFLPVVPLSAAAVLAIFPGVRERMFQGFADQGGSVVQHRDDYEITSGRNIAWPLVIDKVWESPLFGYGREAMVSTGLAEHLLDEYGESFPHPHNAYLQILLDGGLLGFLCVVPLFLGLLWCAIRLFLDRDDRLMSAVGGTACALISALLIGGMGGQTFYPREGYVGMWAAIGLALRVWVERRRSLATGLPLFSEREREREVPIPADEESFEPA